MYTCIHVYIYIYIYICIYTHIYVYVFISAELGHGSVFESSSSLDSSPDPGGFTFPEHNDGFTLF